MRRRLLLLGVLSLITTLACESSENRGALGGGGFSGGGGTSSNCPGAATGGMTGTGDGGTPFCRTTVDPNISGSLRTLDSAIADACQLTATTSDVVTIDRGSTYTYLSIYNVDVATVYVYDKNGAWVATLRWGANLPGGCQWICTAGPADFDQSQVAGPIESAFVDCSGATGDGGVD